MAGRGRAGMEGLRVRHAQSGECSVANCDKVPPRLESAAEN